MITLGPGMRNIKIFKLSNGIRVVHQHLATTKIVHCGIILDIGSRDENPQNQGIAHFWEHMAFKGTKKRKAFHILNRLDSVGGELNAYTTKEKICFYSTVLKEHWKKATELLCDITFNSIFPPKQIEKERQVILEEMAMYRDSPDDSIQDEFDELLFPDHALGKNILGTEETVSRFQQQDFLDFIGSRMDTSKIVFSVVGNIGFDKILKQLGPFLESIPSMKSEHMRSGVSPYQAKTAPPKRTSVKVTNKRGEAIPSIAFLSSPPTTPAAL
jgi:predicted Zn-dependent peptidase